MQFLFLWYCKILFSIEHPFFPKHYMTTCAQWIMHCHHNSACHVNLFPNGIMFESGSNFYRIEFVICKQKNFIITYVLLVSNSSLIVRVMRKINKRIVLGFGWASCYILLSCIWLITISYTKDLMRLHWQVAANIAMHILLMEADRSALEVEKEIMFEICPTTSLSLQASKQKQQCLGKKRLSSRGWWKNKSIHIKSFGYWCNIHSNKAESTM